LRLPAGVVESNYVQGFGAMRSVPWPRRERSVDGLRRSTQQRSCATRRKITKALKEMRKKGLAINPHALANYAGVARKSIYNHRDLLDQIRAETPNPTSARAIQPDA
jgi:hypothetical protein